MAIESIQSGSSYQMTSSRFDEDAFERAEKIEEQSSYIDRHVIQSIGDPTLREHLTEAYYAQKGIPETDSQYVNAMKQSMQMIAIEQILDDKQYDAKEYGYMIDAYEAYLYAGDELGAERFMSEHEDFREAYDAVTATYEGIDEYCDQYQKYVSDVAYSLTGDEFDNLSIDQQLGVTEGAKLEFNTKVAVLDAKNSWLFDYTASEDCHFTIAELAQSARDQIRDYEIELGLEDENQIGYNRGFNEISDEILAYDEDRESTYADVFDINSSYTSEDFMIYDGIDEALGGLPRNMDECSIMDENDNPIMTYRDAMKESMFDDFADQYGFDYSYDDYLENPELFADYEDIASGLTEIDDYCNSYNSAMNSLEIDAAEYADATGGPESTIETRMELYTAYMTAPENDFLDTLNNNFPRAGGIAVDFEIERQYEVTDDGISLMNGVSEQDAYEVNGIDAPLPDSDSAILRDVQKTASIGAIEPKQIEISMPGE